MEAVRPHVMYFSMYFDDVFCKLVLTVGVNHSAVLRSAFIATLLLGWYHWTISLPYWCS